MNLIFLLCRLEASYGVRVLYLPTPSRSVPPLFCVIFHASRPLNIDKCDGLLDTDSPTDATDVFNFLKKMRIYNSLYGRQNLI